MIWNLENYGEQMALLDENGTGITYRELQQESRRVADMAGRRCLVFCLCRNTVGSVIGYVGFLNAGIVPALLNSRLEKGLLDHLLSVYEPAYLWVPEEQRMQFPDWEEVYTTYQYCLLRNPSAALSPLYSGLGLLLTTSGSTGSPKFVRQSYTNISANAASIAQYLRLTDRERPITTLPMQYTYGLSILNSHLLVGATILVTEASVTQKRFWEFLRSGQATSFGGVPYTYEMLDRMRFTGMELPDLRTMTQAGGKLTPELHRKFAAYARDNGKEFIVMYGQCEATARMGYLPADKAVEKCGSMGIAIPGGHFCLMDEDGQEIRQPDATGELVYTGKNVTLGYAECAADLLKGDERNGILWTGDMARFDRDGYYYIVGRKKRFLKIYGNRVNLDEIDQLIKGEFGAEAASAGVDDHMYLFVTDISLIDRVRDFVIGKTGLNPIAFKVLAIAEIPKNDAGKVLYKELQQYITG